MENKEVCEKLKRVKALIEEIEWDLKESYGDMRRNYRDYDYRGQERDKNRYGY